MAELDAKKSENKNNKHNNINSHHHHNHNPIYTVTYAELRRAKHGNF